MVKWVFCSCSSASMTESKSSSSKVPKPSSRKKKSRFLAPALTMASERETARQSETRKVSPPERVLTSRSAPPAKLSAMANFRSR